MSTAKSPLWKLKIEAHRCAHHIFANWRALARKDPAYAEIAVAMDDGFRFVKMLWSDLETATLAELEAVILTAMQTPPGESRTIAPDHPTLQ
jgi:hypothetical protein